MSRRRSGCQAQVPGTGTVGTPFRSTGLRSLVHLSADSRDRRSQDRPGRLLGQSRPMASTMPFTAPRSRFARSRTRPCRFRATIRLHFSQASRESARLAKLKQQAGGSGAARPSSQVANAKHDSRHSQQLDSGDFGSADQAREWPRPVPAPRTEEPQNGATTGILRMDPWGSPRTFRCCGTVRAFLFAILPAAVCRAGAGRKASKGSAPAPLARRPVAGSTECLGARTNEPPSDRSAIAGRVPQTLLDRRLANELTLNSEDVRNRFQGVPWRW